MQCLREVLRQSSTTLQLNELESIAGLCFRALESSNHDVRCAVAHLLGGAAAAALTLPKLGMSKSSTAAASANQALAKGPSAEEVLSIISTGFLRGGGGFLKGTGEMIKGPAATSREVRVGVTMVNIPSLSIILKCFPSLILQCLAGTELRGDGEPTGLNLV